VPGTDPERLFQTEAVQAAVINQVTVAARPLAGGIELLDLGTAGKFDVLSDELRVWPPQFLALREEGAVGQSLKHAVLRRVAGFLERRVREKREEPYQPYQRNRSNR